MSSEAFDPEQPLPPPVEDWAARIDELLLQAETAPAGAERTAVLCRVSEIYERRLGDPNGALVTLQTALAEDPTSGRVIQEMERIARGNGFWGELVAVTAEVAEGSRPGPDARRPEDRKQAADLWVQIAFWNETGRAQLDEATKAAESGAGAGAGPRRRAGICSRSSIAGSGAGIATSRSWRAGASARRPIPARSATPIGRCCATSRGTPVRSKGSAVCTRRAGEWDAAAETLRRLVAALPEGAGPHRGAISAGAAAEGAAPRSPRAPRSSWRSRWPGGEPTCRACCFSPRSIASARTG